ncbi:MAG: hypothetical protein JWL86_315 [Rhizobium sp.]|nr:hypothetical protein [Rhizobium sp.]
MRRGRVHQILTDDELKDAWVNAIERLADHVVNPRLREDADDLRAEMTLRKFEPPYELAKESFERLAAAADQVRKAIERNDPDQYQDLIADIDADISRFKSDRDRAPN